MNNSMLQILLKQLEKLKYGELTFVLPDGREHHYIGCEKGATGHIHIHDLRTISGFAAKGDIGLAEAYRNGWWDSNDLTSLFTVALQNEQVFESYISGSILGRLISRLLYFFSRNTLRGSRRNISAHYDLGNDFYSLWLDPTMTYSSAIYASEGEDIVKAQHRKYDRMLDRLALSSGSILEIGCGWGGFAERATERGDFGLKGITLSTEQRDYAANRLGSSAKIALEDYRHQKGKYDGIVSIEMLEAVGEQYWPTYFEKLESLLMPKGRAMIQTITIADRHFEHYRRSGDMIRSFIFPGGMLPSPSRFEQEAKAADLKVTDRFSFGKDYARTLQEWLKSFELKLPEIRALGYDEPFIRLWRFYLTVCIAGFETGRTDVMQMELQHA